MLCCHSILCVSDTFLFLFWFLFLTHGLFRTSLFSMHILGDFPAFLFLLICSFIPLWLGKILDMISIIRLLNLVLWSILCIIYPGECPCVVEKVVYLATVRIFCICHLSQFSLVVQVQCFLIYFVWMICPLLKVRYWIRLFLYCCLFLLSGTLIFALYF